MKNFIFKAIVMAVVALVAVLNASAQQVVNGINTSDFGACKTYLYAHPGDTILSVKEIPNGTITRKVFMRSGKIATKNDTIIGAVVTGINTSDFGACKEYLSNNPADTIVSTQSIPNGTITRKVFARGGKIVAQNDTVLVKERKSIVTPTSVKKDNKKVVLCNGEKHDTLYYANTKEVAFDNKLKVLRGEAVAVDPEHKDMTGWYRHRVTASVLGGGILLGDRFAPMVTGRLGYENCHFLFELEGGWSTMEYTKSADAKGTYNVFTANFNAGWKLWQDNMYRSYFAVVGTVGYGYQKTDSDEALAHSDNYGVVFGGALRYSWGISKHVRLIFEGGYMVYPKVEHNTSQDFSYGGAFTRAGISYTW